MIAQMINHARVHEWRALVVGVHHDKKRASGGQGIFFDSAFRGSIVFLCSSGGEFFLDPGDFFFTENACSIELYSMKWGARFKLLARRDASSA